MSPPPTPPAVPQSELQLAADLEASEAFEILLQHLNHGLGIGFAG